MLGSAAFGGLEQVRCKVHVCYWLPPAGWLLLETRGDAGAKEMDARQRLCAGRQAAKSDVPNPETLNRKIDLHLPQGAYDAAHVDTDFPRWMETSEPYALKNTDRRCGQLAARRESMCRWNMLGCCRNNERSPPLAIEIAICTNLYWCVRPWLSQKKYFLKVCVSVRSFEPWWIARRDSIGPFDVRYRGYGDRDMARPRCSRAG